MTGPSGWFFEGFVSNGGFFGMVFLGLEDSNGVSEVWVQSSWSELLGAKRPLELYLLIAGGDGFFLVI